MAGGVVSRVVPMKLSALREGTEDGSLSLVT